MKIGRLTRTKNDFYLGVVFQLLWYQ